MTCPKFCWPHGIRCRNWIIRVWCRPLTGLTTSYSLSNVGSYSKTKCSMQITQNSLEDLVIRLISANSLLHFQSLSMRQPRFYELYILPVNCKNNNRTLEEGHAIAESVNHAPMMKWRLIQTVFIETSNNRASEVY